MRHKPFIFRKPPRTIIVPKSYVIITEEGIDFVMERYSSSVELDPGEIKIYEFLIRLLSFDGVLPLTLIKRRRESEILKKTLENDYVAVSAFGRKLPKRKVEEVVEEIWGKIPKGIYV
jgi:hypothetical protein